MSVYTKSQQLREEIYGKDSPEYAYILNDLAWGYHYKMGEYDQAEKLLQQALNIYDKSDKSTGYKIMSLYNLGEAYQAHDKNEEAEAAYKKMYEYINSWYHDEADGENKKRIITLGLESYSSFLRKLGRDEEAVTIESRLSPYQ